MKIIKYFKLENHIKIILKCAVDKYVEDINKLYVDIEILSLSLIIEELKINYTLNKLAHKTNSR